jgi:hypothetical protein
VEQVQQPQEQQKQPTSRDAMETEQLPSTTPVTGDAYVKESKMEEDEEAPPTQIQVEQRKRPQSHAANNNNNNVTEVQEEQVRVYFMHRIRQRQSNSVCRLLQIEISKFLLPLISHWIQASVCSAAAFAVATANP